jgi:hypothetical protein
LNFTLLQTTVADPTHFGTDLDPAISKKTATKKIFCPKFLAYYFLKLYLHNFLKIKSHKLVTKQ